MARSGKTQRARLTTVFSDSPSLPFPDGFGFVFLSLRLGKSSCGTAARSFRLFDCSFALARSFVHSLVSAGSGPTPSREGSRLGICCREGRGPRWGMAAQVDRRKEGRKEEESVPVWPGRR